MEILCKKIVKEKLLVHTQDSEAINPFTGKSTKIGDPVPIVVTNLMFASINRSLDGVELIKAKGFDLPSNAEPKVTVIRPTVKKEVTTRTPLKDVEPVINVFDTSKYTVRLFNEGTWTKEQLEAFAKDERPSIVKLANKQLAKI